MRRFPYPGPEHPDAWIALPAEWLGRHERRRQEAFESTATLSVNSVRLTNATIALALLEDWGGIPGLEGRDPAQWDLEKMPLALMMWLSETVLTDFGRALIVPKAPSAPPGTGPAAPNGKTTTDMAGVLAPTS